METSIRHMKYIIAHDFLWDFTKNHYLHDVLSHIIINLMDLLYLKAESMLLLIQTMIM